jgi:hypothetical protein
MMPATPLLTDQGQKLKPNRQHVANTTPVT